MRIGWIVQRHPPDGGGMARSSGRQVASLRERGHEVRVLHLDQGRHPPDGLEGGSLVRPAASDTPDLLFPRHRAWLAACDVLVGFGGGLPAYLASLWGRWLGRRSAALFRGADLDTLVVDPQRGWMVHQVLAMADRVGAVSSEMAGRLAAMSRREVSHIPNSLRAEEWKPLAAEEAFARQWRRDHVPQGRKVVGVFGELKAKKGLDLVMSLPSLLEGGPELQLLTVGTLAEELGPRLEKSWKGRWQAIPFQTAHGVVGWYRACDVLLLPSLHDGTPNVALEAMAAGLPVVASRAGGVPDLIEDGVHGFLFEPGCVEGAAEALLQALLLPEEEREALIVRARGRLEDFTPEREVLALEALFAA